MPKYKLRLSHVCEDANQTNNTSAQQTSTTVTAPTNDTSATQIATLKNQYMQVQQQIQIKTKQYQTDVNNLKNKMLMIASQIAKLGGDAIDTKQGANESRKVSYRLSKNLFESLQTNKADELTDIIIRTFDELPELSYILDDKGSFTFARRLLSWINEQDWNDGEDHSAELGDRVVMYLSGNSVSMSKREISDFIEKFLLILKENTIFNWIFGRDIKNKRYGKRYGYDFEV
jgi:hypothetical protein